MSLLFPRDQNEEFVGTADAATRRLSLMSLETDVVEGVYGKMASVYDLFFGLPLHHGRATAIRRMGITPDDQILEVGVGTGMSLPLYPRRCAVTAVDLSESMLERAHARTARYNIGHVRLIQMDATHLDFPDNSFDIVYAPYFISCVPDPIAVTREMRRVCRRAGASCSSTTFSATDRSCRASSAPSRRSPCTWDSNPISICRRSLRRRACGPTPSRRSTCRASGRW